MLTTIRAIEFVRQTMSYTMSEDFKMANLNKTQREWLRWLGGYDGS